MKAGWEVKSLGEIADIQSGSGFPEKYQGISNHSIPFYKVSDMNLVGNEREMIFQNNTISELVRTQLGASIFPEGSTIFPKIGGAIFTNKKRITSKDSCVDNNVMGAIPKKNKVDSQFLYYFFQSHDLVEFANDAHLPSIRKTVVESWPIKIPLSITEQQRIVAILDRAFEGIAKACANAEQNLQNARALFESHLQSVFTQGDKGWQESKLDEVCNLITCGVAATPKYVDESVGVPFLSAQNVRDGEVVLDKYRYISKVFHQELTKKNKPTKGDVLYSRVGSKFGEAGVVEHEFEFSVYVSLTLIKPIPDKLDSYFLKYYLNSPLVKSLALKSISSSGVPNLNVKDVREFPIKYPSISIQKEFVEEIYLLRKETQRLEALYQRKIALLGELKKSLLQQAFAGEL